MRIVGSAIDQNSSGTSHIEIDVTRWSTPAEETRLLGILEEKGQDAMIEAMRKMPKAGLIRLPGQLGYDLRLAILTSLPEGGREMQLATDRLLSASELIDRARSVEYPFIW